MKRDGMKRIAVLVALTAFSSLAPAQAEKPAAPAGQEAAKPAVREAAKPRAKSSVVAKKSRRSEDARRCLDRATNTEIIKCAEEYL
jgi:curli biogenesis system outer membrane secretion channel CsgG